MGLQDRRGSYVEGENGGIGGGEDRLRRRHGTEDGVDGWAGDDRGRRCSEMGDETKGAVGFGLIAGLGVPGMDVKQVRGAHEQDEEDADGSHGRSRGRLGKPAQVGLRIVSPGDH